jgi:hypothetical protein
VEQAWQINIPPTDRKISLHAGPTLKYEVFWWACGILEISKFGII